MEVKKKIHHVAKFTCGDEVGIVHSHYNFDVNGGIVVKVQKDQSVSPYRFKYLVESKTEEREWFVEDELVGIHEPKGTVETMIEEVEAVSKFNEGDKVIVQYAGSRFCNSTIIKVMVNELKVIPCFEYLVEFNDGRRRIIEERNIECP